MDGDIETHRSFAVRFFNQTWALLDKPDRTPDEDLQMIRLAHASRLHWQYAGGVREAVIGEWQVARVHAVLGQSATALLHAQSALDLAAQTEPEDFLRATALEVMARAQLAAGQQASAAERLAEARAAAALIADLEDRAHILGDVAAVEAML